MQAHTFQIHADIEDVHWWFRGRRRIVEALSRILVPVRPDTVVVDIGCGTGANIAAFQSGFSGVGIDPSTEAISRARRRFPGITFVCGEAPGDLGGLAARADLCLLMDVLEHVADDRGLLAAIVQACRPGAHILLTVPANRDLWSEHDVTYGHYRRYERDDFARLWEGLPVRVRLVSYFNTRLFPIVKFARMVSRWTGRARGRGSTDLALPFRPLNHALEWIFAGEARRLARCVDRGWDSGYTSGVSLIAILQRE